MGWPCFFAHPYLESTTVLSDTYTTYMYFFAPRANNIAK